jgi:hypothetical protein
MSKPTKDQVKTAAGDDGGEKGEVFNAISPSGATEEQGGKEKQGGNEESPPAPPEKKRKPSWELVMESGKDQTQHPAANGCDLHLTEETIITKVLRRVGRFVGTHPLKVFLATQVSAVFIIPIAAITVVNSGGFWDKTDMSLVWTESGGALEQNILLEKKFRDQKVEWAENDTFAVLMAYGQNDMKGQDILTPEAMAEMEVLFLKWYDLYVTTSTGLVYHTYDLCARGLFPDAEGWAIKFPCFTITPYLCFKEYSKTLDDTYKAVDDNLTILASFPPEMTLSAFSTRPSYKTMTAAEIKEEVRTLRPFGKRGCEIHMESSIVGPRDWIGELQPKWVEEAGEIDKAPGIRHVYNYDPPAGVSYRLSLSKPTHSKVEDIKEASQLHADKWLQAVIDFNKDSNLLEYANLGGKMFRQLERDNEELNWHVMLMGVGLLLFYEGFVTVSFKNPFASRLMLVANGQGAIGVGLLYTASLFFLCGYRLNPAVLLVGTCLQLGLGADDMFVVLSYFNEIGEHFVRTNDYPEIIGELTMRCGIGCLLTSTCNFICFTAGSFIPLPGLAAIGRAMAISAVVNLFFLCTQFLPYVCLEIRRIKNDEPELHPVTYFCHKRAIEKAMTKEVPGAAEPPRTGGSPAPDHVTGRHSWMSPIHVWIEETYTPFLLKPAVKILLSLLSVAFFAASVYSITEHQIGWNPSQIVHKSSVLYDPLRMTFDHFQLFPCFLCFKPSLDVARNQKEMLELYSDLTDGKRSKFTTGYPLPPYLTMHYFMLLGTTYAPLPPEYGEEPNATYGDIGWKLHPELYTDPIYAPFGIGPTDPDTFWEGYHHLATSPADPRDAFTSSTAWIMYDLVGHNSIAFKDENVPAIGPKKNPAEFSCFPYLGVDLYSNKDMISMIQDVDNIIGDSPLKDDAFQFGAIPIFWAVFLGLYPLTWIMVAISLVAVTIISGIMLKSWRAAIVGMIVAGMITMEVWGILMLFLNLNPFSLAVVLIATGLSVEDISHQIAAFFTEASGSLRQRLSSAMKQTALPIFHGSMTTMCSIFPIMIGELFGVPMFLVLYQGAGIAVVFMIGLINGLILLPAMLALFHVD